jgi:hypothetical protein
MAHAAVVAGDAYSAARAAIPVFGSYTSSTVCPSVYMFLDEVSACILGLPLYVYVTFMFTVYWVPPLLEVLDVETTLESVPVALLVIVALVDLFENPHANMDTAQRARITQPN